MKKGSSAEGVPDHQRRPTCTEVVVEDGRIAVLRPGPRLSLAPRVLSRGPVVRVALVPVQACPLNGDHDRIRLHVGAGCTLVLVPIAAHDRSRCPASRASTSTRPSKAHCSSTSRR